HGLLLTRAGAAAPPGPQSSVGAGRAAGPGPRSWFPPGPAGTRQRGATGPGRGGPALPSDRPGRRAGLLEAGAGVGEVAQVLGLDPPGVAGHARVGVMRLRVPDVLAEPLGGVRRVGADPGQIDLAPAAPAARRPAAVAADGVAAGAILGLVDAAAGGERLGGGDGGALPRRRPPAGDPP